MKEIFRLLPTKIIDKINGVCDLEEVRIRANKKLVIRVKSKLETQNVIVSQTEIDEIMYKATEKSIQSYIENIKMGFLTLSGGHRIGLCGNVVFENDKIKNFSQITSLNIRVARKNLPINIPNLNEIKHSNTLIISPPNMGKTTLLRYICKFLSSQNVVVIDERLEIDNQQDLGLNVDILKNIPKKQGVMLALKTMSPDYIICDEITDDTYVLECIANAGVNIVATIHGENLCDIPKKLQQYFQKVIIIKLINNERIYKIEDIKI